MDGSGCQKIFTASVHGLQYFTASFSPWRVRGVFAFFFIKRGRKPFKGASTLIYKNVKRGHTAISLRHIKEAMIIHRESNIRPLFNHDAFAAFSRYFSLKGREFCKSFKGASNLISKNVKRGHTTISLRHIKEAMIIHRESNIRPLFHRDHWCVCSVFMLFYWKRP